LVCAAHAGKTLVDTTAEGPWFLIRLPARNCHIVAPFADRAIKQPISTGVAKLKTVLFHRDAE